MSVVVYEGMKIVATGNSERAVVHVHESNLSLSLEVSSSPKKAMLTAEEARELAKQLYRLAKRLDDRLIAEDAAKKAAQ